MGDSKSTSELTLKTNLVADDLVYISDSETALPTDKAIKASDFFKATAIKKIYVALLSQSGTDAPVAVVLENTLGDTLVWTRAAKGTYHGTLASAFPTADKVFIPGFDSDTQSDIDGGVSQAVRNNGDGTTVDGFYKIRRDTANRVEWKVMDNAGQQGLNDWSDIEAAADMTAGTNIRVEIRVYA